jgi:hypothetical protein
MRATWQQTAATAAILAASISVAAGQVGKDPAAARAFLKELIAPTPLTPQIRGRVEKLLGDLGNKAWKVRDAASKELLRIGAKAEPLLRAALSSANSEAVSRLRQLLDAFSAFRGNHAAVLREAVTFLAGRKDKTAIDALVTLLGHADRSVRHVAEYNLRRFTGMQCGYRASAPQVDRRAAAARWAAWWKANRGKFDFASAPTRFRIGGLLCWSRATREVFLVDLTGKLIWSRTLRETPRSADVLPNGNILVSPCSSRGAPVVEYDPNGKVVWSVSDSKLCSLLRHVTRLPNGNTLALDARRIRAIEIDAAGRKIVWMNQLQPSHLRVPQRLANGNTVLFFSGGEVREVTPGGKVAWSITGPGNTRDAQVLANGNVLVMDTAGVRVVELDRSGKEVWRWSAGGVGTGTAAGARRLPDGRTVVQARGVGLILIDATGKRATPLDMPNPPFICYREFRLAPAGVERAPKGNWKVPEGR